MCVRACVRACMRACVRVCVCRYLCLHVLSCGQENRVKLNYSEKNDFLSEECVFRTIGVVGIDATLEEIENILLNDQWGSVYAFLINNEGETIFHPLLRPSSEVSE